MPLSFGPELLSPRPPLTSDVSVTVWNTKTPATLTSPVSIDELGRVSFTVASSGQYTVTVRTDGSRYERHIFLQSDPLDLSSVGKIRETLEQLHNVVESGGGGGGVGAVIVTTGSETRPDNAILVFWLDVREVQTTPPANMGTTDIHVTGFVYEAPPDTEDPSVPTSLVASSVTDTSFTVTWAASTDNVGVTGYRVLIDGVQYATPSSTSQSVTGRTASTSYDVTVQALDAAGNSSAESALLTVTTSDGASLPTHNVFATPPAALIKTVEASPYENATGFYTYGASTGWKVKGARLYVPDGISVPATCEVNLYAPGSGAPTLGTPTKTATMTGIVSNAWNTVAFPSVTEVVPGEVWWIGIKFSDGTWLGVSTFGDSFVAAADSSTFVLSDRDPGVGLVRNYRRIGTGSTTALSGAGDRDMWFGMDAIVEEA